MYDRRGSVKSVTYELKPAPVFYMASLLMIKRYILK